MPSWAASTSWPSCRRCGAGPWFPSWSPFQRRPGPWTRPSECWRPAPMACATESWMPAVWSRWPAGPYPDGRDGHAG
ncbi:hypothetical protein ACFFX0_32380 [Citricoccus parietis]|uniref:Uncharacterized protein n=1 Tax=Citricoccus parietis TaxID=592307 RepID=A0ABV5G9I8_9MICC